MSRTTDLSAQQTGTPAVDVTRLRKSYGEVRAVDGVDLRVPAGSVYGVLGPNGAGKTTIVRTLATLIPPDSGEVRVLGHDVVREAGAIRDRIGLTGQYSSVDEELSGRDNLVLLARLRGFSWGSARSRAEELLATFDLDEAASRLVRTYSGGMRRRLDIASSTIVTPDLMFLDEPTTGLDPHSRNQVWELVRSMVAEGATVLLTTQYLDEADQLADRIAVIDHGRVIAEGTPVELKRSVGSSVLRVRLRAAEQRETAERMLAEALGTSVRTGADRAELTAQVAAEDEATRALAALSNAGIGLAEYSFGHATLDQVFLALTGHPADGERPGTDPEEAA
ncbi:ATP-binding cassette domain-containing protein [Verrucosispora sp. WMMD573]|uniref:ATP-binding cassette domain-containing protein n=1 Tax=Verrucosispora sp. WMMD573 TaxID=3015149 RepID=UPI00248C31D7|nr:ATP-binding cassette domain-containing protein [Verrucosispora sp. WMMD573]WBB57575.1 ATP-binding cassette domain-containing protein [Verrucosispora sp. WMMD573]